MKGPLEGFEGIFKGSVGLFKYASTGVSNSIVNIFDGVTSVTSFFTFDDEYIKQREKARMKKPKNIGDGFKQGG